MPHHQSNHAHQNDLIVWLVIDGLGLCMITACTSLDAIFSYGLYLHNPLITAAGGDVPDVIAASLFWWMGRTLQVVGLLLLIAYAATFQRFIELDRCGMMMLTVGENKIFTTTMKQYVFYCCCY